MFIVLLKILWFVSSGRVHAIEPQTQKMRLSRGDWFLTSAVSLSKKKREQHILLKTEGLGADEEDWLVFTAALRIFSSNFFRPLSADIVSERAQTTAAANVTLVLNVQHSQTSLILPANMGNSKMKIYFIGKFKNSGYL